MKINLGHLRRPLALAVACVASSSRRPRQPPRWPRTSAAIGPPGTSNDVNDEHKEMHKEKHKEKHKEEH